MLSAPSFPWILPPPSIIVEVERRKRNWVGHNVAYAEKGGCKMLKRTGWGVVVLTMILLILGYGAGAYADEGIREKSGYGIPIEEGYTRVVVRYSKGVAPEHAISLNSMLEMQVIERIEALNAVVVRVPQERVEKTLSSLRADPNVLYAEVDGIVQATFTPNDPEFSLHQYAPQIIQADKAWDITRGSPEVLVAVVDTGVDYTHPELDGKVVLGYDFVNDDSDPMDDNGHGTHVAGIIAATTNNGVGIASVGYETRVMAVKVLSASGGGFYSAVARGITYAADNGARIVNLSLRGTVDSSILQDAINYAWNKGILVVAAAGNDGDDVPVYPAAYPHVMAVAATDWNDNRWSLSNFGEFIDVAAPGIGIYSTDWDGGVGPYASRSGTSMAAPHVAAVAALALAVNPTLTNAELETLLKASVDDLGDPGWDPYYGAGRINAYKAVQAAGGSGATTGLVNGYVWMDKDGNGLHDDGETGMAGVTVELYREDGTRVASTATDAAGTYTFESVEPGTYYVQVTPPVGYVFTLADRGDEARDSDVSRATGQTATFTLTSGETLSNIDAGLIPTGKIGGLVWVDPNANSVPDAGETNVLADVAVHVTGTTILGETVDLTLYSGPDGRYEANSLLPGTYQVEVSDQVSGYVVTSPNPQEVILTADELNATDVNFGFIAPTLTNLIAFTITPSAHAVAMRWEVSLNGGTVPTFHVWRSENNERWVRLTQNVLFPVEDDGRTATYRYTDTTVQPGHTYAYRLEMTSGEVFGPWSTRTPEIQTKQVVRGAFLPLLTH